MTEAPAVRFEQRGRVGRIVLDRPEDGNAFDIPAAQALGRAIDAATDPSVHVVVVGSAGPLFCGGGDITSFLSCDDPSEHIHALATELERELRRLGVLPKPVIAAVHGSVAGAGLALILNCDLVIASRAAKFVFACPGIGLTPDCGVSYLLPRAVGQQRALEFALSGRALSADEAREWGLVTDAVDAADLTVRVDELTERLAAGVTDAYGEAKRLIRGSWETSRAESAQDEAATLARRVRTDEARRLISAFISRDEA